MGNSDNIESECYYLLGDFIFNNCEKKIITNDSDIIKMYLGYYIVSIMNM